jgi:hypothetical protein
MVIDARVRLLGSAVAVDEVSDITLSERQLTLRYDAENLDAFREQWMGPTAQGAGTRAQR